VREFVLPPITKMIFTDRGVDVPRGEVVDKAPPSVSPGAGMTQAEQPLHETCIALTALGMSKVEELPNREVAGMGGHEIEKPGFHFGVTKGAEADELVFSEVHGLKAQDRCTQLPVVADAAQPVRLAMPGIDLKAGASLLRKPVRTIMVRGKFEIAALDFGVVFLHVLDAEVRNRNLS